MHEFDRARFFDLAPALLAVLDRNGEFHHCNADFEEFVGRKAPELTGRPALLWVHPDDRPKFEAQFATIAEVGTCEGLVVRIGNADGLWRSLSWNVRVDPATDLMYVVARDISRALDQHAAELGSYEQRLRAANWAADASQRA